MAKPAVTLRTDVAPSPLTFTQLDTNFVNLRDATISLTADTGGTQVTADLNGNITIVAGTGVTITGDNSAKTITIDASGGGDLTSSDLHYLGENDTDLVHLTANPSPSKKDVLISANMDTGFSSSQLRLASDNTMSYLQAGYRLTITGVDEGVEFGSVVKFQNLSSSARDTQITPEAGHVIFNTSTNTLQVFDGTNWVDLN